MEEIEQFIKRKAKKSDLCYYYEEYTKDQREALENIYKTCWRFNLKESQTIFMLNEMLRAFYKEELVDIL